MKQNVLHQLAGPLLFLLIVLVPAPPGMSEAAQYTAGISVPVFTAGLGNTIVKAVHSSIFSCGE